MFRFRRSPAPAIVLASLALAGAPAAQAPALPSTPMSFGAFTATFGPGGVFALEGQGWPAFKGTYKTGRQEDGKTGRPEDRKSGSSGTIELLTTGAAGGCDKPARYSYTVDGQHVTLDVVADECVPRRMILDHSTWRPSGEAVKIPERRIVRSVAPRVAALPEAGPAAGSWPSFRGPQASGVADGQHLPDRWNVGKGENILWRTAIPGLAHSSPIAWGDRLYVTSAVSTNPAASFKPGLYGDGDASDDRSRQQWMLFAVDKATGKIAWQRVACEGVPLDKRHMKSTYASASPATDGRIVVASFGSQGVYAYDVNGNFRWKVDLGRMNMGAYDIPTFEWGPASSPVIWNGLVFLQVDTQEDSFLLALQADSGKIAWKTRRAEIPSWGTPTVAVTPAGPRLVTNASNFIRGYDPASGRELWKLGGSSKITAPTPVFADGVFVVASGRAPERPIFVVRADARGDITPPAGKSAGEAVVWSRTGRGPYMPTPLVYNGIVYVLANNGVFDAYDLATGEEIYRQRLERVGNGFSASPIAADGRIYLSNEDGDILVVEAGRTFKQVALNEMGELVMATPALSGGAMYVRTAKSLVAIGRR
jgi:outer membrane protein assembly factor BamB